MLQTARHAPRVHPADTPTGPSAEVPPRRVAIEQVTPEIDAGRFAAKGIVGDPFMVEADAFADGHDVLTVLLVYRGPGDDAQRAVEMTPLVNDRFQATILPDRLGIWEYSVIAWTDRFRTWRRDLEKRAAAESVTDTDLQIGAALVSAAAERARAARAAFAAAGDGAEASPAQHVLLVDPPVGGPGRTPAHVAAWAAQPTSETQPSTTAQPTTDRLRASGTTGAGKASGAGATSDSAGMRTAQPPGGVGDAGQRSGSGSGSDGAPGPGASDPAVLLEAWADRLVSPDRPLDARTLDALDPGLADMMDRWADRAHATQYRHTLTMRADPERARASAWYELFPRSASPDPDRAGTLRDVIDRLPYIAAMGFDVLYLPPIHPIGRTARKGPNNAPRGGPDDPGSPWAIGGPEGGHTAIHPELGTFADFEELVAASQEQGIDLALDMAFQCSPDHPWVREHPEWFQHRPDGSIQYAENPPKKYQDIYPLDFESEDWPALWQALADVMLFWCAHGVRIFRVDNPHTKAFPFWEWAIAHVRERHPETLFLAEAFTRPKVMHRLAKLGFTHSYTYFAWRNEKWSLEQYLAELHQTDVRHFFRPHFWPNTPDILTEHLQHGGRAAFITRFVLAATGSQNYGIYGPAYELMEHVPRDRGSEEYKDSEKYEVRHWNLDRPDSLRPIIARVNRMRRRHPALLRDHSIRFHHADNPQILAYSKSDPEADDTVLVVANLDPHHRHAAWVRLDLAALGLTEDETFQVHDLMSDARYEWHGAHNYVELDPGIMPVHVFHVRRRARTERDFEYYI